MAVSSSITLIDLITLQAQRLEQSGVSFGHGTTNAFDEAAWLVLWRLGLPLDSLDDRADDLIAPHDQEAVVQLVAERIKTRKPAAYLTGEAWLQGVPFHVDERVIVPRSLIAEPLVEGRLDAWLGKADGRVLDLCTGNGSLAVLAALAWHEVQLDASDLSDAALEVARINVHRHGLDERIRLLQGDGLSPLGAQRYDLILCNPPYVNRESMNGLPAEYRAEPALALAGGSDGMDFIRQLLNSNTITRHLTPQGALVLEIGHEAHHFRAAFPQLEPVWMETSGGEEQVLVLSAQMLDPGPEAGLRPGFASGIETQGLGLPPKRKAR